MDRSKTNNEEVIYLDEVKNETSKPLTSTEADATPTIRSRANSISLRTDNKTMNNSQLGSGDENYVNADKNSPIDFNEFESNRPFVSNDPLSAQPPLTQVTPDVNLYQHKKTLAQGMMDLALLSANANQMRYVLQTDGRHPYFYPSLTMIGMSLFLQIVVGMGLIWNSRYNVKKHEQMCKANKANNWTVIGIFLVTILNVFISSFGVVDQIQTTPAAGK